MQLKLRNCPSWRQYLLGNESLLFYAARNRILSISLILITSLSESINNNLTQVTCAQKKSAESIANRLRLFDQPAEMQVSQNLSTTHIIPCDSHIWKIQYCTPGVPSLCVDCADPCTASCSAGSRHHVSPCWEIADNKKCTTNYRRNNYQNIIHHLSIVSTSKYPAPTIQSLHIVKQVNTSNVGYVDVRVKGVLSFAGTLYCGYFLRGINRGYTTAIIL